MDLFGDADQRINVDWLPTPLNVCDRRPGETDKIRELSLAELRRLARAPNALSECLIKWALR